MENHYYFIYFGLYHRLFLKVLKIIMFRRTGLPSSSGKKRRKRFLWRNPPPPKLHLTMKEDRGMFEYFIFIFASQYFYTQH